MLPTNFIVRQAAPNERLDAAKKAGDVPAMQRALGELTSLYWTAYGSPKPDARLSFGGLKPPINS
jgi:hypothetical protein